MALKKTHINTVTKLLDTYTRDQLVAQIDQIEFKRQDQIRYNQVMETDQTAVDWFHAFCAEYNLTVTRKMTTTKDGQVVPYGLYYIDEFGQSGYDEKTKQYGPYFMLWIHDGHQNDDQTPHIEMGTDFSKYDGLWFTPTGLEQLEHKMRHICHMRGIKPV